MAEQDYIQAIQGVTGFRGRCEIVAADCNAFRNAVELQADRLARGVGALPDLIRIIADNVQFLRVQLGACQAAAKGAERGLISYEEAARRVNASLDGADIAVDGLDGVQANLTGRVDDAIEQIRALQEANNVDLRQQHQQNAHGGGRRGGRRRRRGGFTPTPCHKRCCGTGTRFSNKRKKCVEKKRRRRSRRRRR